MRVLTVSFIRIFAATLLAQIAFGNPASASPVFVYWADGASKIERSEPDESNLETVLSRLPSPKAIALDPIHEKIFWTTIGLPANVIERANLDGSNH
jgi:hypothetical protein